MGIKMRRAMMILMAAAVMLSVQAMPLSGALNGLRADPVYADFSLTTVRSGAETASPGDENVSITIQITNGASSACTINGIKLNFSPSSGITVKGGMTAGGLTLAYGQTISINFNIDISERATTGMRYFEVVYDIAGQEDTVAGPTFSFNIAESLSYYAGAVDFTHIITPTDGFSAGGDNTISFEAFNKGNTTIRNAELSIILPEGMSVNNSSNMQNIGYMGVGERKTRTFPILVDDNLEGGKTYPVTIKLTGSDMSTNQVSAEKTFYIPVIGDGAGLVKNLSIQGINVPGEVTEGKDFNLSFSVKNSGTGAVKNTKVSVTVPEGILNKTTATFVENSIGAGETKNYSVSMFAQKGSNSSYPIKIAVEPLSGGTSDIMQYVSVFVGGDGTTKTPQLMVDNYSYGGSYVKAGSEFFLNLGLYNTSGKTLSNIKITFSSSDGTFVPVDSSNSFFVDKIDSKGHYTKSLRLSSSPTAEQKTTALTVSMSYEDSEGTAFTAEDTISIPLMQEMRLVVDDIVPPYECYVGQPGVSQVEFYNMGKTTLGNLRVTAEGDFDVIESNSYYVGNMEGGKSDSYSFSFIPRQLGPMEGKLLFTYENAAGDEQTYEMPFVFEVVDMPVWEDAEMMPEEEKPLPWALIIFGGVLVIAVVGIVVWRKIRKARLNKKLEILDTEFDAQLDLSKESGDE